MTDMTELRDAALAAVTLAATATHTIQKQLASAGEVSKEDRSPVTAADFASQTIIVHTLMTRFLDIGFIAEESAKDLVKPENATVLALTGAAVRKACPTLSDREIIEILERPRAVNRERAWVLDPVDGTKGFLRDAQYAIALGFLEAGTVRIGVLGCPRYRVANGEEGAFFIAVKGQGAYVKSISGAVRSISVDGRSSTKGARMVTGVEAAHANLDVQSVIREELEMLPDTLKMDGQGKYGAVACGDGAVYLRLPNPKTPDRKECIWDHAAGALLLEEAGGRITDCAGTDLDFGQGERLTRNTGVVATTRLLHERVMASVLKHQPPSGASA